MDVASYEGSQSVTIIGELQAALDGLMMVEDVTVLDNRPQPRVRFGGQLLTGEGEENVVFNEILSRYQALGYTPMLTREEGRYVLQAVPAVPDGRTGKPWVNAVLFVLTLLSVLLIGALRELDGDVMRLAERPWEIVRGWPFALTLLGILAAHEMSHYFVSRRYGSPTSLPYFIPIPLSILGTMGAVIVQRGPMRSRKALFDIGVAGPLGGLLVAIPLLFIGLTYSYVAHPAEMMDLQAGDIVLQEGNSLLYLAAKYVVYGEILPNRATGEDVWLSPPSPGGSVAFAAWAGLLVTALNLFPIGQFDGGHVAYAMWGRTAWRIARVTVILSFLWGAFLLLMGNQAGVTWLIWGGLGSLMGLRHPPPLNDATPLDPWRRALGWIVVVIYLLVLTPIPLIPVTL